MSQQFWWYLARSAGIVAVAMLVASMIWGILLTTRVLKPHDRPAWLLDLHSWLGGLALSFTGVHLIGLFLDSYLEFGPAELFVPGMSPYRPVAVSIGVISLYLMLAVQLTASLRRHLPRRVWRTTHYLSYPLVWGGLLHAGLAGTDVSNRIYQGMALALTVAATAGGITRIVAKRPRRGATSQPV